MQKSKLLSAFSIVRLGSVYSAITLLNTLPRFVILAVAARTLQTVDFGKIDMLFFAALALSNIVIMGLDSSVIRFSFDIKEETKGANPLGTSLLISISTISVVTILLGAATAFFDFGYNPLSPFQAVFFLVLFSIGFALMALCSSHLRSNFRAKLLLKCTVTSLVIRIAAISPFMFGGASDSGVFAMCIAGGYLVSGIVFLIVCYDDIPPLFDDMSLVFPMLWFGAPLGGIALLTVLYSLLERMIVVSVSDLKSLAVYASSAFLGLVLGLAIQIINMVWVPLALQAVQVKKLRFVYLSSAYLQVAFIAVFLFFLVFSRPLVNLLAPIEMEDPSQFFPFIGMIIVVRFTALFASFGLIVEKKTNVKMAISFFNFTASILSAFFFGQLLGVEAVPISIFCINFCFFIGEAIIARRVAPQIIVPIATMSGLILLAALTATAWVIF